MIYPITIKNDSNKFLKNFKNSTISNLKDSFEKIIDEASSYSNSKIPSKIKSFITELKEVNKEFENANIQKIVNFIINDKKAFDNAGPAASLIGKK